MAVTRERFDQGMTYDEYKQQMTRNQERFQENERSTTVAPDELAAVKNLPRAVNVLVLAEDWCGDVIDNLPILGRLAQESGKLNLRVFLRDQNADVMDQYLNQGQYRSIPVFAFFDDQFQEVGRFVERPASVTERRTQLRQEIFAQHPEFGAPDTPFAQLPEDVRAKVSEAMGAARAGTRAQDVADVTRAIREIVARAG